MAHPHRLVAVQAGEQARVWGGDGDAGGAVLAVGRGKDVAAELVGHQLGAIADAQDGDPATPDGRVGLGRAVVVHGHGPAGQDDGAGPAAFQFLERGVVGQQLRVDVQLAHAPRDQLGELAAEVQHDDRTRCGGHGLRAAWPVIRGALRRRGLERGLEIRLHLGVIGSEDPVPGVRRLAVDRLATLGGLPVGMCGR